MFHLFPLKWLFYSFENLRIFLINLCLHPYLSSLFSSLKISSFHCLIHFISKSFSTSLRPSIRTPFYSLNFHLMSLSLDEHFTLIFLRDWVYPFLLANWRQLRITLHLQFFFIIWGFFCLQYFFVRPVICSLCSSVKTLPVFKFFVLLKIPPNFVLFSETYPFITLEPLACWTF